MVSLEVSQTTTASAYVHCLALEKYKLRLSIQTWQSFTANRQLVCHRWKSAFGLAVAMTVKLLTTISNQFIFVPSYTEVVNSVKFTQAVYKTSCYWTFSIWSRMHIQTLCLGCACICASVHLSNSGRGIKITHHMFINIFLTSCDMW